MTAQEVIEILKNNYPKTCRMVNGRYQGGFDDTESDFGQALTMAISALKEIQQYRKIGTVEECQEAREKQTQKVLKFYGDGEEGLLLCPNCDGDLWDLMDCGFDFCPYCGQAIQWNENTEENI